MREILFRGKVISSDSEENGKWIFGQLVVRPDHDDGIDKTFICESGHRFIRCLNKMPCTYEVDPETVGQFTGLTDKNGKRIFERDVLSFPDTGEDGYEYKEGYDFMNVATVCWNNGRWELEDYGDHNSGVMDEMEISCHYDFITIFRIGEVIGNIHDNKELLHDCEV